MMDEPTVAIPTARLEIRRIILDHVSPHSYIAASEVVRRMGVASKAVWPEIIMMMMDGLLTTEAADQGGSYRGGVAMIRRRA